MVKKKTARAAIVVCVIVLGGGTAACATNGPSSRGGSRPAATPMTIRAWRHPGKQDSRLKQAVDWLVWYADGTRRWPYEQITAKPWGSITRILRYAARAYDAPAYE